jgi:hypothetical protein
MNSVFGSACLTSITISPAVRKTVLPHSSCKHGSSVKEASAFMGHSTPMHTLSTYAHVMEGMRREAVNGLERPLLTGYDASVSKCERAAILSHSV